MANGSLDQKAYLAATFRDAERAGLRIAIKGRLVALVLLGAFLVVSRLANPEHALELARFLKPLHAKVNVIPLNRPPGSPLEPPADEHHAVRIVEVRDFGRRAPQGERSRERDHSCGGRG